MYQLVKNNMNFYAPHIKSIRNQKKIETKLFNELLDSVELIKTIECVIGGDGCCIFCCECERCAKYFDELVLNQCCNVFCLYFNEYFAFDKYNNRHKIVNSHDDTGRKLFKDWDKVRDDYLCVLREQRKERYMEYWGIEFQTQF